MSASATLEWTVVELPVPATPDGPDAWALRGMVDVGNTVLHDAWGHGDWDQTAHEVLTKLRHQEYYRRVRLLAVAVRDGVPQPADVLGYAGIELPLLDNTSTAWVGVDVHPDHRRRGIGGALYDAALARVRAEGRTIVQASTDQSSEPPAGPGTLAASTGSGRVRTGDPGVRFALARGFALEQVDRCSVLDVPLDPEVLAAHRAAADAAAGPDYRTVQWLDHCPEEWVDEFAHLETRMSTDAPTGGLVYEEDRWDAARVRTAETTFVERGMPYRVMAAEHVPTHTLVAFTALVGSTVSDEFVHQDDTLVLKEHRGRRLGMLVKAANLQRLAVEQPSARRIGTWNAEENAHMLAINVALGFRPAGGSGEWQLRLT